MRTATILLIGFVALSLLGTPQVAADDGQGIENTPCVKVSVDPPGYVVDPRCHPVISYVWDLLP